MTVAALPRDTDTAPAPQAGIVLSTRGDLTVQAVDDAGREPEDRRIRIDVGPLTVFVTRRDALGLIDSLRAAL